MYSGPMVRIVDSGRGVSAQAKAGWRRRGRAVSFLRVFAILAVLCSISFFAEDIVRSVTGETYERWKLIPWMLPVGLAILAPIFHQARTGRVAFENPFIYCILTYLGPTFVLGTSLFIVTGITDIPEAALISDPARDYPLALLYTAIAIASFGLGVNLTLADAAGRAAGTKLPAWRWPPDMLLGPGLLFFFVGGIVQFANFSTGVIGFQTVEPGRFTAMLYFIGLTLNFGQFMLWFAIFSAPKLDWRYISVGAMMLIVLPLFAALAGNRGYLFSSWLIVVLACVTTGQKVTARRAAFLLVLGALSLSLGIAFGSAFRLLKLETAVTAVADRGKQQAKSTDDTNRGKQQTKSTDDTKRQNIGPTATDSLSAVEELAEMSMRRVTVGQQFELAGDAAATVATGGMMSRVLRGLASRLNTITQLTVLVSNWKALEGKLPPTLGSSIWIGLVTALVPRAIWPDKPLIGDPKNYGKLFFRFSTNSFAMTPFGDLLINFGPLGIAPGMFLLGALMRLLFAALIEQAPGAAGRAAIYALLLSQLSMEGSFGTIIPWLLRTGLVAMIAVLITAVLLALPRRSTLSRA
jgi:hypothetical protein